MKYVPWERAKMGLPLKPTEVTIVWLMMFYDKSILWIDPVSSLLDAYIELKLTLEQYLWLGYPTIFKDTLQYYDGMVAILGQILLV